MSKPGRNDPCYCGSGKKYKQCHLREDQQKERQLREEAEAARFLRFDLPRYGRSERFKDAYEQALPLYWNDLYDAGNAGEMSQFEALRFLDWFVFDYALDDGRRILDIYQEEEAGGLTPSQQSLLQSWMEATPAGAYELLGYDGQVLHLRDYLTQEKIDAFEASGRGNVKIGELILTRLVPVSGRLEFSTAAAYLPTDEIEGLAEKMEAARKEDAAQYPKATEEEFLRRNNYLIIHHALAQAERLGRPAVARLDPQRTDPPIQHQEFERGEVIRQRNYGSTRPHIAQTRRKAV